MAEDGPLGGASAVLTRRIRPTANGSRKLRTDRIPANLWSRPMITNDDKPLAILNSLIRANRDSELGYLAAADAVAEPELVQIFAHYALQRAKFAAELQERVKILRGD